MQLRLHFGLKKTGKMSIIFKDLSRNVFSRTEMKPLYLLSLLPTPLFFFFFFFFFFFLFMLFSPLVASLGQLCECHALEANRGPAGGGSDKLRAGQMPSLGRGAQDDLDTSCTCSSRHYVRGGGMLRTRAHLVIVWDRCEGDMIGPI